METDYINLTAENIDSEQLCCIIRTKKAHPGVEAKRRWLAERLSEGHVFRKLNAKGCCFIEYAPLEKAWTPIIGDNYYYIYCLWTAGEFRGKGHGRELMEYCIDDAKKNGRSGICMLGAKKQKNWLSNQAFAKKYGFKAVDSTNSGYELLALSFDGTYPAFTERAKSESISDRELTVYYDDQCPFIRQRIDEISSFCADEGVPISLIRVETLEQAKELPCVFNNWGAFYNGRFISVNLLDIAAVKKLLQN